MEFWGSPAAGSQEEEGEGSKRDGKEATSSWRTKS